MKISLVTRYQTHDGVLHETATEAEQHEVRWEISRMMPPHFDAEVLGWVMGHLAYLRRIAEYPILAETIVDEALGVVRETERGEV